MLFDPHGPAQLGPHGQRQATRNGAHCLDWPRSTAVFPKLWAKSRRSPSLPTKCLCTDSGGCRRPLPQTPVNVQGYFAKSCHRGDHVLPTKAVSLHCCLALRHPRHRPTKPRRRPSGRQMRPHAARVGHRPRVATPHNVCGHETWPHRGACHHASWVSNSHPPKAPIWASLGRPREEARWSPRHPLLQHHATSRRECVDPKLHRSAATTLLSVGSPDALLQSRACPVASVR
mmetsp:Transcript_10669/g.28364  ORF Transcript_10669/g.28364 Transcript_10669/m.28364 type:complete len:231 (-) Transcript_10669:407-1099(-)